MISSACRFYDRHDLYTRLYLLCKCVTQQHRTSHVSWLAVSRIVWERKKARASIRREEERVPESAHIPGLMEQRWVWLNGDDRPAVLHKWWEATNLNLCGWGEESGKASHAKVSLRAHAKKEKRVGIWSGKKNSQEKTIRFGTHNFIWDRLKKQNITDFHCIRIYACILLCMLEGRVQ